MLTREQLIDHLNRGLSVKQVADQIEGITLSEVRNLVEEHGLESYLQDRSHWKWTDGENDDLISAWMSESRPTLKEVAEVHKRSVGAISTRIRFLIREGKLPPEARPISKSKKWKAAEVKELKKLVKQGKDWSVIADALDRTETSVRNKYERETNPKLNRKSKKPSDDVIEIVISGSGLSTTIKMPRGDVNIAIPSLGWETTVASSK